MDHLRNEWREAIDFLKKNGFTEAETGIVLGTGLGEMAEQIDVINTIAYNEIPHFPVSTVEFHKGRLIYGMINNKKVFAMQGRFHYYEGYSLQEITFPIHVMHGLGIKQLLLSNAAGGINLDFKKSDLVLIKDHINLIPGGVLKGKAIYHPKEAVSDLYDKKLCQRLLKAASEENEILKAGVYAAVQGPNLETRAEYRFLKKIGADMVGMSTAPEVIVAHHLNLPCAAVSVITDECDPDNLAAVDIADIIAAAQKADMKLSRIFSRLISEGVSN